MCARRNDTRGGSYPTNTYNETSRSRLSARMASRRIEPPRYPAGIFYCRFTASATGGDALPLCPLALDQQRRYVLCSRVHELNSQVPFAGPGSVYHLVHTVVYCCANTASTTLALRCKRWTVHEVDGAHSRRACSGSVTFPACVPPCSLSPTSVVMIRSTWPFLVPVLNTIVPT